jgi:hypothetical protein
VLERRLGSEKVWFAPGDSAVLEVGGGPPRGGDALAIVEKAIEAEDKGAGDPQTAAGEDERDQPTGEVGPTVQVGGCLDLGHDVLGEAAVDLLNDRRNVAGVAR